MAVKKKLHSAWDKSFIQVTEKKARESGKVGTELLFIDVEVGSVKSLWV